MTNPINIQSLIEKNRQCGCWTCLSSVTLQKGLTRVEFYKGIDLLGETRYKVRTTTWVGGNPGTDTTTKEVTKDEGNALFTQLKANGYGLYRKCGVAC